MKIIDLLNKINNNEEVPEKIKFDDTVFKYNKSQQEYNYKNDDGYYETLLYRVMTTHFIDVLLKAEVEVIEENKEIKELDNMQLINARPEVNAIKINELVRAVNKINKQIDTVERELNKMFQEREEK